MKFGNKVSVYGHSAFAVVMAVTPAIQAQDAKSASKDGKQPATPAIAAQPEKAWVVLLRADGQMLEVESSKLTLLDAPLCEEAHASEPAAA